MPTRVTTVFLLQEIRQQQSSLWTSEVRSEGLLWEENISMRMDAGQLMRRTEESVLIVRISEQLAGTE